MIRIIYIIGGIIIKIKYLIVLIIGLLGGYLFGIYTIASSNKEVTINIEGTYQKDRVKTISIDNNTLYYYFKNTDDEKEAITSSITKKNDNVYIIDNTSMPYDIIFIKNDDIILMNSLNKDVNYFTKVFNYASFDES